MSSNNTQNNNQINLDEPRYDQSTYFGRLRHFFSVSSPLLLLTTDKKLQESITILNNYKKGVQYPEEVLWKAKEIKDAMIHPDTGEKIPMLFRASCFVPVNMVIASGLLIPNASITTLVFWQWVNQSYNVCFNHSNRNASNNLSNRQIFESYLGATALSCSIAIGMSLFLKRSTIFSPGTQKMMRMFLPFVAAGSAGAVNVYLMRRNELTQGITVYDEEGNDMGKSQTAGLRAINQVAISRVLTTLPILTIPPVVMLFFEKAAWYNKNPRLHMPIKLAVITAVLFTALPGAVAVFPQKSRIASSKLEPQFHNLTSPSTGLPIKELVFNKGV